MRGLDGSPDNREATDEPPPRLDTRQWYSGTGRDLWPGTPQDSQGDRPDPPNTDISGLATTTPARNLDGRRGDTPSKAVEQEAFSDAGREPLDSAPIVRVEDVGGASSHINQVYRVELADGRRGYLKPEAGEDVAPRPGAIPEASQWRREVAAYEFDQMAGLGLVPETVRRQEDEFGLGVGSLQREAPIVPVPYHEYSAVDRQSMAVLDYTLGNLDRHDMNYRTSGDGRPAAIDNGLCLPENADEGIRSQWVADCLGQELDVDLVERLRQVDTVDLTKRLQEVGISDTAIAGMQLRLAEVRQGFLTGQAWRGEIYDGRPDWHKVRDAL
jgi:hypothetical protein